ncbi:phage holin family protein [Williamsia sp. CHRR-6]|uniref:phage holin family protein n=1 Tax=Williamsia sp. CHRR-6 TaxID=2835871 RepID=UPI001BDAC95F|nr:phage holin family protein [Williamsia sp. CHRR-6]MBT0567157.1 phage holin family protein [Williamsia sp. CHRR-6]
MIFDGGTAVSLDDRGPAGVSRDVTSIPLSDPHNPAEQSIGGLVKDATAQMSTLLRAEVELAKTELVGEAKKAGIGTGLIVVALTLALYASFFFFFFLGELLDVWLPRWAAFGIVFLILLVVVIVAGLLGYRFFKKLTGPKKTIASVSSLTSVLPGDKDGALDVTLTKADRGR